MAQTLEEERPVEADLLSLVGTTNRCTVGSSIDSVVVIGNLLRGHCLMGEDERKISDGAGKASGTIYMASA